MVSSQIESKEHMIQVESLFNSPDMHTDVMKDLISGASLWDELIRVTI